MASKEEIKAFFSDEEKVKALMNDEEFINKISGEQSTPEVYAEEFKKFGLELSEDEAEIIQKTISKIMSTPTDEIDDSFLESVAGGKVTAGTVGAGAVAALGIGFLATEITGIGFVLAGRMNAAKAKGAYKNGDYDKCHKYLKKANKLNNIGSDISSFGYTKALRRHEGDENYYTFSDFFCSR